MTSGGSSDSTTAPTIQKMLVTTAQRQSRVADHNSPSNLDGRAQDVGIDRQIRRRPRRLRDEEARRPAQQGKDHHHKGQQRGLAATLHRNAAGDSAAEDREKGGTLDERIARRQLLALQMIRQNAVFDRPEQRADHSEQEQGDKQQRQRIQLETANRDRRGADLGELEPARHGRLVEAVGELVRQRPTAGRTVQ